MLAKIQSGTTNEVLIRKADTPLADGLHVVNAEFSTGCSDTPEVYAFLAFFCSGMVKLTLPHDCENEQDEVFNLDTGTYTVTLRQGLTTIHSLKIQILL